MRASKGRVPTCRHRIRAGFANTYSEVLHELVLFADSPQTLIRAQTVGEQASNRQTCKRQTKTMHTLTNTGRRTSQQNHVLSGMDASALTCVYVSESVLPRHSCTLNHACTAITFSCTSRCMRVHTGHTLTCCTSECVFG